MVKLEDFQGKIDDIARTTAPKSAERRRAQKKLREQYLSQVPELQGLSDEEFKVKSKEYAKAFNALLRAGVGVKDTVAEKTGRGQLSELMSSIPTDAQKTRLTQNVLLTQKLDAKERYKFGNMNSDFTKKVVKEKIMAFAETLDADQKENLIHNYTVLAKSFRKAKKRNKLDIRSKKVSIDSRKYLGATSLSKGSVRKGIYDHWEEVAKRYDDFDSALGVFFDSLIADAPTIQGRNQVTKLRDKFENKNLEYLARFGKLKVSYEKNPIHRLMNALYKIQVAENLSRKEREASNELEEDVFEQGDWAEAYMAEMDKVVSSPNQRGEMEGTDLADEEDEETSRLYALDKRVTTTTKVDPLLAFEVLRNKKLLGIEEESLAILKDQVESLKDVSKYIDFQADMSDLLDQLEDSATLEQDTYVLPISILTDQKFKPHLDTISTLSDEGVSGTATEKNSASKGQKIGVDVVDLIDELFRELHFTLTDERFGFENAIRATGRGRTLGTVAGKVDRKQKANERVKTLLAEYGRSSPINPATRGKITGLYGEEVKKNLTVLLKTFDDYYVAPLFAGKTPITIPPFASTTGFKVLSVFAKDMGVDSSVLSDAYEMLSSEGRAFIKPDVMSRLADFLETLDAPAITVTESLVIDGEEASQALSEIFGQDEKNHNYFAAVLKHYMDLTGNEEFLDEDFLGKPISERALAFEKSIGGKVSEAYPIFVLPQFIDLHQSILTRKPVMKTQYNRLKRILDRVEDDLPVVLTKLLKAHDAIREQMGKPVEYGFMKATFDNYDRMITKMDKEHGVDLSHYEVESIVKAIDSHSNIAKEFGVSEDHVYYIKANFR